MDTTVSGTENVTIANAAGTTTLDGAEISGNSINVATKDLTITTAQDTSRYNSKTTGVNASFSVPVWGAGDIGGSASFSHSKTTDSYASTEATQSGLYAGAGGLNVSVADATTLNGGVIGSTADAALNHLTTGSLIANDIANYADASAKTMGYQANVMNPGGATGGGTGGMLTAIGTGMASNAGGLLGASVHQDASSVTHSAIGSNVQIAAGSISGPLSRDPSSANHPLTNSFDAQKMQNDLQIQQVGSQVVGEVGGVISDALNNAGISGFGTTDVGNAWGRIGLETAGSALVAGLSGGNIGATAAGTAAGDAAAIATREWAGSVAQAITNDGNAQRVIENMLSNAIGASAGAAGGAAGSGHTMLNALTGAGYASAIQQFNQDNENEKTIDRKDLPEGLVGGSSPDQPQIINVVYSKDYKNEYDLVGASTSPVRDENGKAIFREKTTGDYYVFVDGQQQLPSIPQISTGSHSGLQQTDTTRAQVDPQTGQNILTQVEKQAALNDLRNSHLSYLINPDSSFIGTKGTGNAQVMPGSFDPNATAQAFAKQAFVGNTPLEVKPVIVKGYTGWVAKFSDGSAVTYRPAGAASFRTSDGMATVEINTSSIKKINGGSVLKFKFPGG